MSSLTIPDDALYMRLARTAASKSTDRSRQVGCVIVDPVFDRVVSHGANHFPKGVKDIEERHARPEKYFWCEHAERNAIYSAARRGRSLSGCIAYLPWFPCMDCARGLVQSGIKELVAIKPTEKDMSDPKWGEDFLRVEQLLIEADVKLRFVCD